MTRLDGVLPCSIPSHPIPWMQVSIGQQWGRSAMGTVRAHGHPWPHPAGCWLPWAERCRAVIPSSCSGPRQLTGLLEHLPAKSLRCQPRVSSDNAKQPGEPAKPSATFLLLLLLPLFHLLLLLSLLAGRGSVLPPWLGAPIAVPYGQGKGPAHGAACIPSTMALVSIQWDPTLVPPRCSPPVKPLHLDHASPLSPVHLERDGSPLLELSRSPQSGEQSEPLSSLNLLVRN